MSEFFIRFPALIAGVVLGFILLRMYAIDRPIFYKWPSPENAGKVTYKDKNGVCYSYNSESVDCKAKGVNPKPLPLQIPQPYAVMK